jgi:hypothetical protein
MKDREGLPTHFDSSVQNSIHDSNPGSVLAAMDRALTVFRETEIMAADSRHPKMSILPLLRARSPDEPGTGISHAGISEGVVGHLTRRLMPSEIGDRPEGTRVDVYLGDPV